MKLCFGHGVSEMMQKTRVLFPIVCSSVMSVFVICLGLDELMCVHFLWELHS